MCPEAFPDYKKKETVFYFCGFQASQLTLYKDTVNVSMTSSTGRSSPGLRLWMNDDRIKGEGIVLFSQKEVCNTILPHPVHSALKTMQITASRLVLNAFY